MSSTVRPVHQLLDLLGRRWALRILWELREGEALTFRALQERCDGMSASVLNERLGELREGRLVERTPAGYVLTGDGAKLLGKLEPLDRWARRWATRR
jgi:DNA-binding HxlR family transcriptional regulator